MTTRVSSKNKLCLGGGENEEQDDDVDDAEATVQLGFSEPLHDFTIDLQMIGHRSHKYKDWDGGQIGGTPSWLDPQHIPVGPLYCQSCRKNCNSENIHNKTDKKDDNGSILRFVCQLYAPPATKEQEKLDDESEKNKHDGTCGAFHRSLYVFACPVCCSSTSDQTTGSVRVIRQQLPRINQYYPDYENDENINDDDDENETWTLHTPEHWGVHLCQVCGLRATSICPQQNLYFCCRSHQVEYFHYCKKLQLNQQQEEQQHQQRQSILSNVPSVYPLTELVVEEEPPAKATADNDSDDDGDDDEDGIGDEKHKKDVVDVTGDDETDSDAEIEQDDLNDMTGAARYHKFMPHRTSSSSKGGSGKDSDDPFTAAFFARILHDRPNVQQQCLRYYCPWQDCLADKEKSCDDEGNHYMEKDVLWMHSKCRPLNGNGNNITNSKSNSNAMDKNVEISNNPIPPPCEQCGAPRHLECQIMPQMLSALLPSSASLSASHTSKASKASNGDRQDDKSSGKKASFLRAMQMADEWIHNLPPEMVPPSLVVAKQSAIQRFHEKLQLLPSTTAPTTASTDKPKIYATASTDVQFSSADADAGVFVASTPDHTSPTVSTAGQGHEKSKQSVTRNATKMQQLDWGIVTIYSCTACCDINFHNEDERGKEKDQIIIESKETQEPHQILPLRSGYYEEYAWRQPSLDFL